MITATKIEKIVNTGAKHVLYRQDGGWYHHLKKFPGVLFDKRGYVLFETKNYYDNYESLTHRKDLNVKEGISSLANYKRFTSEEVKKIESLNYRQNKLDKSDTAWEMLLANAKRAKSLKEIFFSPVHKKPYQVISVSKTVITIQREGANDSKIGKQFFINRINEVNKSNGRIDRLIIHGHVAKIAAIVYLSPWLEWSDDLQAIVTIQPSSEDKIFKVVKSDLDSFTDENSNNLEGGAKKRLVSYYERKPNLRAKAILIHGTTCKVCQFNFKENYGTHGEDYIEVHHLVPIHTLDQSTKVNPATDMIVVCANCHRMIHRKKYRPLSIEEIIKLWSSARKSTLQTFDIRVESN